MQPNVLPIVTVEHPPTRNELVLTIASPVKNSLTQLYSQPVQVSVRSVEDLNRKVIEKFALHHIREVHAQFIMEFSNDRTKVFNSAAALVASDMQIDALTNLVSARWTFVLDATYDREPHLHSVFLRISERPNPGLFLQRIMSGRSDDLQSLEGDAMAPVACKIDFLENRFGSEMLAVVSEWVSSLPRAEPTLGVAKFLRRNEDAITSFVYGTFPSLAVLAALGVWMAYLPEWIVLSNKHSVAWILGSAVLFLLARYFAQGISRILTRHLARMCNVPVFLLTSGDANRMTRFLAKSQRSLYALAAGGLVYGIFKAIGLYLTGVLIVRLLA